MCDFQQQQQKTKEMKQRKGEDWMERKNLINVSFCLIN